MMQSNQPYHRVDDGIGAGLIGGAAIGGAVSGSIGITHGVRALRNAGGGSLSRGLENYKQTRDDMADEYKNMAGDKASASGLKKTLKNLPNDYAKSYTPEGHVGKFSNMTHGSTKRAMISTGASLLGGALIGAGIDNANNR
jgi:outer membrane lipoprotein SlyB